MQVWHNYSFDKHILSRHGIHAQGFYADTMHLARLWDSARRGTQGGYSLEALTSDEKVMDGLVGVLDKNGEMVAGKRSMKTLFGKANIRKDGTPGKLRVIPPVEELQRAEDSRELWIHYSAYDAVCTFNLWQSLQEKLKRTPWKVVGLGMEGSMYDFYEEYWRPFGELLVKMEADGMLVDCNHLAEIEKIALSQQKLSVSRFRKWAAKYCPDAALMNVGSDAQIRQLLWGGVTNRLKSCATLIFCGF
jgi:DNA polymerase-1